MWFLHIGAFYYIHEMERMEAIYVVNQTALAEWNGKFLDVDGSSFLSPGVYAQTLSYGSLQDPAEAALGFRDIDMGILDKVSAALPITWFFVVIGTDDLQHWTKMITVNCLLAIGKGMLGFMTVIPDSIGWQQCKERETDEGITKMKNEISNPRDGFWGVFWSTFVFEAGLMWQRLGGGKGVRFCADMMYSGHTYFTTLYALGLLELTRMHTRRFGNNSKTRLVIVSFVFLICVSEQLLEIVLMLMNRFHYTMDVFMAIVMTFLLFTNGSVCKFAKWWYHWRPDKEDRDAQNHGEMIDDIPEEFLQWLREHSNIWALVPKQEIRSEGDVWTPLCCVPFCCFWGRTHLISDKVFHHMINATDSASPSYEPVPSDQEDMESSYINDIKEYV